MKYLYAASANLEDFSSGRVLRGFHGAPAFPVRLASELFQRAQLHLQKPSYHLYDPCCGGGYSLTVLALLHGDVIQQVSGSDIDADALLMARSNLRLLTRDGLGQRRQELEELLKQHGKQSHRDALLSLARFEQGHKRDIPFTLYQRDLYTSPIEAPADILFCDLPYGKMTSLTGHPHSILDALEPCLVHGGIAIVASAKKGMPESSSYNRVFRANVGERTVAIFQKTL